MHHYYSSLPTGHGRPSVGVLGASGLAGRELCKLLWRHPQFELSFAASRASAGQRLDTLDPAAPPMQLSHPDQCTPGSVDAVMLCLPHGHSGPIAERWVDAGVRTIDLSGDFRLSDPELHQATYGTQRSRSWAQAAVYGLTELARPVLREATLVANPGCYPTCTALALLPLAQAGLLGQVPVVVNAISGVSGAGATPTELTHFCSAQGDLRPYKVGRVHRHVAEMEQTLGTLGRTPRIIFSPHLAPFERGILATITVQGLTATPEAVRGLYEERYRDEPFVRLLPAGESARVRAVAGTNDTAIALHPIDDLPGSLVVTCAIDNLLKGAAGQAVQNLNLLFGMPEALGLPSVHLPQTAAGDPRESEAMTHER